MNEHLADTGTAALAGPLHAAAPPSYCECEGEKVAVRSIRVTHRALRASAVVRSFWSMDTLLSQWTACCQGMLDCDFEILYQDGLTICGSYQFARKRNVRPALMQFVRTTAESLAAGEDTSCTIRGLSNRPLAFLDRYEIDDYAPG